MSKVHVILVNFRNWPDTAKCLEALRDQTFHDFTVTICDNGSKSESMDGLQTAALEFAAARGLQFAQVKEIDSEPRWDDNSVLLIMCKENRGFAGGCNIGIRRAMRDEGCRFMWILNNDTIPEKDALAQMVLTAENAPSVGIVGSRLHYSYNKTTRIQALGGAEYNRWLARGKYIGFNLPTGRSVDVNYVVGRMDYVVGASMLVSRTFVHEVGEMCEDYFLYFEEIDWAVRGRKKGFSLGFSDRAIVWHRVGGSIGTSMAPGNRSALSEYYQTRSRIKFTKKFFPAALPTVLLTTTLQIARRVLRRQPEKVRVMLLALLGRPYKR